MHYTLVEMKDGTTHYGPIYMFRPKEGYLTLMLNDKDYPDGNMPDRLYFRDMKTAVTKNERMTVTKVGDRNEIARAKENGWDGA